MRRRSTDKTASPYRHWQAAASPARLSALAVDTSSCRIRTRSAPAIRIVAPVARRRKLSMTMAAVAPGMP
jgi:hypothetical protein